MEIQYVLNPIKSYEAFYRLTNVRQQIQVRNAEKSMNFRGSSPNS